MAADPADPEQTSTDVDDAAEETEAAAVADGAADTAGEAETAAAGSAADEDTAGTSTAKAGDKSADAKTADAAKPAVVRKKVVSKRVTPKGGPQTAKAAKAAAGPTGPRTKASPKVDVDEGYSKRYTPPAPQYARGPSPWWVPTLMFGFLIIGALVIMLNYSGVFGDPQNIRLIIGLGFILGGIITATQYR